MDDTPSIPNMIVNYSIIIAGLVMTVFIISASFYFVVRRERILNKKFPLEDRKVDPWGYPLEDKGNEKKNPPPDDKKP